MSVVGFKGNVDSHSNEVLSGWIADPANPARTFDVEFYLDGARRGRITAGFPRPDVRDCGLGSGFNGFYFMLPPAEREGSVNVEVREAGSQNLIGEPIRLNRTQSPKFAGLSSTEAQAMLKKPLLGVGLDAFRIGNNVLTVNGMYLPPGGDPFAYDVIAEEGVTFQLHRPLHDKGALEYFWFWPNVQWGAWRIEINLGRTNHRGSAYRFVFRPKGEHGPDHEEVLCVPKDLGLWQNLPSIDAMNRVQLYDFPEASPLRAAGHCRPIADLAQQHLGRLDNLKVLDWGCGWGRLTRTFAASAQCRELWGIDIDHDNLAWARENIPAVNFLQVPLYPPTKLPADHFDLVYAVSVMTHLTRDAQAKWLAEVRRVLRPGGVAILTFHGCTALAFASAFLSERMVENFKRNGFDDSMECNHLDAIIGAGYYKSTFQTQDDVRTHWGQHLKVVDIRESAVGMQDAAVLVKPQA
ncbi:MAG: class I SAM-dependent methyltransferase [Hyphomonadaceae bacterium]|jgi:SAM-dependent methyltransferase|nr:class I SAM-dependent methyltransferase [Hyphomonadaceae bacterium]